MLKAQHGLATHIASLQLVERVKEAVQALPAWQSLRGHPELLVSVMKLVRDQIAAFELSGQLTHAQAAQIDKGQVCLECLAALFDLSEAEKDALQASIVMLVERGIVKSHAWRQCLRRALRALGLRA